jgi:Domain of unknown function (DUF1906)
VVGAGRRRLHRPERRYPLSTLGLDYSSSLSDPQSFAQAAKAAGYAYVMRYLAPLPNAKVLTAVELTVLHAAGLGVGLVSEKGYGKGALGGAAAGVIDGPEARVQATGLGFPPDFPIFGAVDFDPTPDQYPTIAAYLGAGGFEPYGNGAVCTYMLAHGFSHFWLMDWGGHNFADPHLHQHGGQVTVAGISCDLNEAFYDDCIWWPPSHVHIQSAPAVTAAQPQGGEDDMQFSDDRGTFVCDASGAVYTLDASGNPADGGRYLGGLNSHPQWGAGTGTANGPPFAFGPTPADTQGRKGYFITTRDPQGHFHPYVFPGDGSLK